MNFDYLMRKGSIVYGAIELCDQENDRDIRILKFWGDLNKGIRNKVVRTTAFKVIEWLENKERQGYDYVNYDMRYDFLGESIYHSLEQKYIIEKLRT